MSFAVAGLLCEGALSIKNGECVNISYPEFYSIFIVWQNNYLLSRQRAFSCITTSVPSDDSA